MSRQLSLSLALLFVLLFAFGENSNAAISNTFPRTAIGTQGNNADVTIFKSKKQKKKWRLWEKLKAKWAKGKKTERKKISYGMLGLIAFVVGLGLTFVWGWAFLIGSLISLILGIVGLFEDENHLAAIIAIALSVLAILFVVLVFIYVLIILITIFP